MRRVGLNLPRSGATSPRHGIAQTRDRVSVVRRILAVAVALAPAAAAHPAASWAQAPASSVPPDPAPGSEAPPARSPAPLPPLQGGLVSSGVGALTVSARFGKDGAAIGSGLVWRVYTDKPEGDGSFKLVKEERGASPTFALPPGGYIMHVALGFGHAAKRVQVRAEPAREVFELAVGGVRFDGRVGESKIPPARINFEVYRGSQFDPGEKRPVAAEIPTGNLVLLPEGIYHVVSNYGDGNAVMRSDFRIQPGKLTDATVSHRAAAITLKLVGEKGGEALANTAWSVLTPGGDVIKESIGAYPVVVLAEGDYIAIARHEGKVFNREFKVEPGPDREVELLAR